MKKSMRSVSAVLAGLILLSSVSCSENSASDETASETVSNAAETYEETAVEEETKKYLDDLPETLNFAELNRRLNFSV